MSIEPEEWEGSSEDLFEEDATSAFVDYQKKQTIRTPDEDISMELSSLPARGFQ